MGLTTKERNLLNRTCPNLKKAKLGDSLPFGATVQLNGVNPTKVTFTEDTRAIITGTEKEPFDFSNIVGDNTIVYTADGGSEKTIKIEYTAGTSVSGESPSTDISASSNSKFMISVDGDEAEEVTVAVAGKTTGAAIATELQTKIQALGGNKTGVTVAYSDGVYVVTSPTLGTNSSVVITPASANDISEELKLGADNGGTETAGTGDVADATAITAQEIANAINEDAEDILAMVDDGKLVLATVTAGKDASLTIGEGTTHTVLGLTGSAVGAQGLDWVDMPDTNYIVVATLRDVAAANLAGTGLSIRNRQKTSFEIECEDTDSEAKVDLIILR